MVKLVDPEPGSGERPARRRGGWQLAVVALFTLGAFTGSVWYAYDQGVEKGITLSPPVIRADPSPTKVRPEDPGGLAVPHQDKLVYETLTSEQPTETAEHLLPPPEEPLSRPQSPPPQPVPPQPSAPSAAPAAGPAPPQRGDEEGALDVAAMAPAELAPPAAPRPQPEPPVAAAAETRSARTSAHGFRIQLAAYREADAATQGWHKLSRTNPSLLKGLKPNVIRVDLGADKGVFYRLQAGPLADRETADTLCAELKRQKVGCLVVKP
jgi:hypothetical protein